MNNLAFEWAWEQTCVDSRAKFVLLALADDADAQGACCLTILDIAEKTGTSRNSVLRALRDLEDKVLMQKVSRRSLDGRQASVSYQLMMGERRPVSKSSGEGKQ